MSKALRYFATLDEAIKVAKQRSSGSYKTQYVYNYAQQGKELFYIRGTQEKDTLPIVKVLFDGTVQNIRLEGNIVHAENR